MLGLAYIGSPRDYSVGGVCSPGRTPCVVLAVPVDVLTAAVCSVACACLQIIISVNNACLLIFIFSRISVVVVFLCINRSWLLCVCVVVDTYAGNAGKYYASTLYYNKLAFCLNTDN